VGLVHDLTTKLKFLQKHETVLEPQNSIGNDVFFDGWNESYNVQSAMQNNLETWFFRITT
jgi:hypothetical protein